MYIFWQLVVKNNTSYSLAMHLCLCSGSLGTNPNNDVADIIRTYCDRIAFAHIRNIKHYDASKTQNF